MKICSTCNLELPLECFSKKTIGKLQSKCKKCQNKYCQQHYKDNKSKYISKARKHNKEYQIRNRDYIYNYRKLWPCIVCQESDPSVLDFHHVDRNTKEYPISAMISDYLSIETIDKEISKCIIICSNCHRKHHAGNLDLSNIVSNAGRGT